MHRSSKKIVALVCLLFTVSMAFSACGDNKPDGEFVANEEDVDSTKASLIESAHPSEEFMEGVAITQVSDDTFGFDGPGGETVIDTKLPEDFPEDAPVIAKAEVISSAKSQSEDGVKMVYTVFWVSDESMDDLLKYVDPIKVNGWELKGEDDFETSRYFRFLKEERALDFSVSQTEEDKREVMVMVEK